MKHLKVDDSVFDEVASGKKSFEYRLNDRDYRLNDILHLSEYILKTKTYTGRYVVKRVSYIIYEGFGIPEGYCIMSIVDHV